VQVVDFAWLEGVGSGDREERGIVCRDCAAKVECAVAPDTTVGVAGVAEAGGIVPGKARCERIGVAYCQVVFGVRDDQWAFDASFGQDALEEAAAGRGKVWREAIVGEGGLQQGDGRELQGRRAVRSERNRGDEASAEAMSYQVQMQGGLRLGD